MLTKNLFLEFFLNSRLWTVNWNVYKLLNSWATQGDSETLHWNKLYRPENFASLVCSRIWWHNVTRISLLQVGMIRLHAGRELLHIHSLFVNACSCQRSIVSSETSWVMQVCWLDNAMTYALKRTSFCSPSFFFRCVPSLPLLLGCSQC